jgi:hypothetical protein
VQPLGQRPGGEGRHVDPVERFVVHLDDIEAGRRLADRQRALVAPRGQAMGVGRVEPEPGEHVAGGQPGKIPEGTHTEPAQQISQLRAVERLDGLTG